MFNSTAAQQSYEMSLSPTEFLRSFARMMQGESYQQTGLSLSITRADRQIQIDLTEKPARKIALLTFPVTEVKLSFQGYDEAQIAEFMQRFGRSFQRGGG